MAGALLRMAGKTSSSALQNLNAPSPSARIMRAIHRHLQADLVRKIRPIDQAGFGSAYFARGARRAARDLFRPEETIDRLFQAADFKPQVSRTCWQVHQGAASIRLRGRSSGRPPTSARSSSRCHSSGWMRNASSRRAAAFKGHNQGSRDRRMVLPA